MYSILLQDQLNNTVYCDCDPGYTGAMCDTAFSVCDPNPCNNGNCTVSLLLLDPSSYTGGTAHNYFLDKTNSRVFISRRGEGEECS